MKKLLALALIMFMAACSATVTNDQMFQMACGSVETSVRILTAYKASGDLSESQINQINEWKPVSKAVCNGNVSNSGSGLQTIIDISNGMLAITNEVE